MQVCILNDSIYHISSPTHFYAIDRSVLLRTSAVYIAKSNFTSEQIVENVISAMPKIIERIHGKWSNIASLSLKSTNSIALPFYNSLEPVKPRKSSSNKMNLVNDEREEGVCPA